MTSTTLPRSAALSDLREEDLAYAHVTWRLIPLLLVGNLAGFVSPFAVGWIRDATGSTNTGLYVIAATLVVGSAIILATTQRGASKSAS